MLPTADKPTRAFDCETCVKTTGIETRRSLHCGWMDERDWTKQRAEVPPAFGPYPYDADVCPGWLTRQDFVTEGSEAYMAAEMGVLEQIYPELPHPVWEAIRVCKQSFTAREAELMKPKGKPDGR